MSAAEPGSYADVAHGVEGGLCHERLLLGWVESAEYVVASPDVDLFIEHLGAGNAELESLRFGDRQGAFPVGLAGSQAYSFETKPTGAALAGLLWEASSSRRPSDRLGAFRGWPLASRSQEEPSRPPPRACRSTRRRPRSHSREASPSPEESSSSSACPPRVAGASGSWVLDEPGPGGMVGQEVVLPSVAVDFGGRAFVSSKGEIRSVTLLPHGADIDQWVLLRTSRLMEADPRVAARPPPGRPPTLAEAFERMQPRPASFPELKGPATLAESIASVLQRTAGGGFMAYHGRWVVESKIDLTNRSRHEHRLLCRALHFAATVDGLNLRGLVALEYLNRRRLLLEEAHRDDVSRPNFESAHLYMGEEEELPGAAMSSSLRAHMASELGKEAAILKERRKAREARGPPGKKHAGGKALGAP